MLSRRLRWALWLLLALAPATLALGPPRLVDGDVVLAAVGGQQLAQARAQGTPTVRARAAVLVDAGTSRRLYERDADRRLPPASTTKMMTALVALGLYAPEQPIRVSAHAATIGGSSAGLATGETLPFAEMLFALLLPSGNDAAMALAEADPSGAADFVDRMNARAASLGLANTHFLNPTGLDDDGHYASAADLAALALAGLRVPAFAAVVRTADHTIPAGASHRAHELHNLNQLLKSYQGADGVKTGTTPSAGQVLVASAARGGHRLLAVVLNSPDRYADAPALLDYGFAHYAWLDPRLPPPFTAGLHLEGRPLAFMPPAAAPILERWLLPSVRVEATLSTDAGDASHRTGSVSFYLGAEVLATYGFVAG